MYKKTIVLLKNKPVAQVLKGFLQTRKKDLENDSTLLNDFEEAKKDIIQNRHTGNLRKHFGDFIIKNGMPYLMFLDYRSDLGLPSEVDPDRMKIINTFLISFCMLAHTPSHAKKRINLVILLDRDEDSFDTNTAHQPSLLLKTLKTQDERVNTFISNIVNDNERARNLLNIRTLVYPETSNMNGELDKVEEFLKEIDLKLTNQKMAVLQNGSTDAVAGSQHPADVICRATSEKIVRNGEIGDATADEKRKYFPNYISLEGSINRSTGETVQKRIVETLTSIGRLKPIGKESRLVFLIPDESSIDDSFNTSMGMLFTNLKSKYPGIAIDLGEKNLERTSHSPGFIAIRGMITRSV